MTLPSPYSTASQGDMRLAVRRPRASDGVGNALRQVFSGQPTLPQDMACLLNKLSQD